MTLASRVRRLEKALRTQRPSTPPSICPLEPGGAGEKLRPNPYLVHRPTEKQGQFLRLRCLEAMYGGAAGGGKSDALLMAALEFVDQPGYAAILFRRTLADLSLPGGLIERTHEWLSGQGVRWNAARHEWAFPSGASLSFGYLDSKTDRYRYQGSEFQYIGFDELTQFPEEDYRYLFSRLRRRAGCPVPLRMRAASNPGGLGHAWVKARFLRDEARGEDRVFLPARLEDNPHLDRREYERALAQLDPITRVQLRDGNWDACPGGVFRRDWFRSFHQEPDYYVLHLPSGEKRVEKQAALVFSIADTASTTKTYSDYTAIGTFALIRPPALPEPNLLVLDMVRAKLEEPDVLRALEGVNAHWQPAYLGVEAALSGYGVIQHGRRLGLNIRELSPHAANRERRYERDKYVRATEAVVRLEAGQVWLPVSASWREDFEAELLQFTAEGRHAHDDQVDVLAYAAREMALHGTGADERPVAFGGLR